MPSASAAAAGGRGQRADAGQQQGQPHRPDPAQPVGHRAPDRLAEAVDQEVRRPAAWTIEASGTPRSCAITTSIGGIANRSSVLTNVVSWSSRIGDGRSRASRAVHQAGPLRPAPAPAGPNRRRSAGTSSAAAPASPARRGRRRRRGPARRGGRGAGRRTDRRAPASSPSRFAGRLRRLRRQPAARRSRPPCRPAPRSVVRRRPGAGRRRPRPPCRGTATGGRVAAASRTQPARSASSSLPALSMVASHSPASSASSRRGVEPRVTSR